jgi:hypothetical protein
MELRPKRAPMLKRTEKRLRPLGGLLGEGVFNLFNGL